jgi:hypothetical protein
MEQELQMASCLFGGPPVQDDIIKLSESQIGFMNIFARPLFEAVTDILPAMQFAVDEILANTAVWEQKIDDEREHLRKNPSLNLGLLAPTFATDPTPSPFSGGPPRQSPHVLALQTVHSAEMLGTAEETARRESTGSGQAVMPDSQRSSSIIDKTSRRSSAGAVTRKRGSVSHENQGSRRGSVDPSLTAILVTQAPNSAESPLKDPTISVEDHARGERKDTLTHTLKERDGCRPVTAPSQARRSQSKFQSTPGP